MLQRWTWRGGAGDTLPPSVQSQPAAKNPSFLTEIQLKSLDPPILHPHTASSSGFRNQLAPRNRDFKKTSVNPRSEAALVGPIEAGEDQNLSSLQSKKSSRQTSKFRKVVPE
jgi:hypothetical protein